MDIKWLTLETLGIIKNIPHFGSTYTKIGTIKKISMALVQGWHTNLWSVPYLKEEKNPKHPMRIDGKVEITGFQNG